MSRFLWECDCGFTNLVDEAVCFNCEAGKPELQTANEGDERPAKKARPSESELLPSGAMPETVAVTHENAEVAVGEGSGLGAAKSAKKAQLWSCSWPGRKGQAVPKQLRRARAGIVVRQLP